MTSTREVQGLWWYPDNPAEQWLGTLSLSPAKVPSLTVTVPATMKVSRVEFPPVLYGRATNDKPVTLFHPAEEHSTFSSVLCSHTFSAGYAIIGEQLAGKELFKVNELTLKLHHLPEWVGRSGFQGAGMVGDTARVSYRMPELLSFKINESLSLSIVASVSVSNAPREGRIQENTCLTFDNQNGLSFAECFDLLNAVRHLLHFGVLKPIYPIEVTCTREGFGSEVDGAFIPYNIEVCSALNRSDVEPVVVPDHWVFRYSEIRGNFGEFFGKWLKLCSAFEEALGCYFATVYNSLPQTERLLCLTQALEAYHGEKHASHDVQDFIAKVRQLAQTYETPLKGLVDDIPEFAEIVRDNRNYYTHHNPKWRKDGRVVSGGELVRLNEKLKVLMQMCVLSEIGIPEARFVRLRHQIASRIVDYS